MELADRFKRNSTDNAFAVRCLPWRKLSSSTYAIDLRKIV